MRKSGAGSCRFAIITLIVVLSACSDDPSGPPVTPPPPPPPPPPVWHPIASLSVGRFGLALVASGGHLFAIGGSVGIGYSTVSRTMEEYDPATNMWTVRAPMPTARRDFGAAEVNGLVYAAGGSDSMGHPLTTVEAYDPTLDTWVTKASLPDARAECAVAALNGRLYVVGGYDSAGVVTGVLTSVESYDPVTESWSSVAPLPVAFPGMGATVLGGVLYVLGGRGGPSFASGIMQAYEPLGNTWLPKATVFQRAQAGVAATATHLYAIGGDNGNGGIQGLMQEYDPLTDSWEFGPTTTSPRVGLGAAAIRGTIYAVGGRVGLDIWDTAEAYTPEP